MAARRNWGAKQQMQTPSYSTWKQVAFFGAAGPLIGAFAMLRWSRFADGPPLHLDLGEWLVVGFAAYLYAGVPALFTGCVAALIRRLAPGNTAGGLTLRCLVPVLAGAAASALFWVAIASELSTDFAVVGAFAAFVCTSLVELWLRLWSKRLSKPNPLRGSA